MLIPHDPYVFNEDGSFVSSEEADSRSREENFVTQLKYTNILIKDLIETLIARSEQPPIIIIQSDEGPFPDRFINEKGSFDWRTATLQELAGKFGILNAYYFPGFDKTNFYPNITPVNSFRILFNHYFDADFAMLPDMTYATEKSGRTYDLFSINDRLGY